MKIDAIEVGLKIVQPPRAEIVNDADVKTLLDATSDEGASARLPSQRHSYSSCISMYLSRAGVTRVRDHSNRMLSPRSPTLNQLEDGQLAAAWVQL